MLSSAEHPAFVEVRSTPEFRELRNARRRFVFPVTVLFLLWYAAYVLLGTFAREFMAVRLFGNINVGLVIGLGQFVTTFAIAGVYARYASRALDPRAEAICTRLES